MSAEDKRDFTRAIVGVKAEIITKETLISGLVGDVSLKGLFLICDDQLPEGMECTVHLFLGDQEPPQKLRIETKGVVIRNLDNGIAVEFTELDLDSYDHLKHLVSLNATDTEQVEHEFKDHLGLKKGKKS